MSSNSITSSTSILIPQAPGKSDEIKPDLAAGKLSDAYLTAIYKGIDRITAKDSDQKIIDAITEAQAHATLADKKILDSMSEKELLTVVKKDIGTPQIGSDLVRGAMNQNKEFVKKMEDQRKENEI